jgi:hypothetical protein
MPLLMDISERFSAAATAALKRPSDGMNWSDKTGRKQYHADIGAH